LGCLRTYETAGSGRPWYSVFPNYAGFQVG
jgi:hypothetical protein